MDKVEKLFVKLANEINGYTPPEKIADNYSAYTTKQNADPQVMANNQADISPTEPGKIADNENYHAEYSGAPSEKSAQAVQALKDVWVGKN